jgi:hypothetical protein
LRPDVATPTLCAGRTIYVDRRESRIIAAVCYPPSPCCSAFDRSEILNRMRYLLPLLLLTAACGSSPTAPTPAPTQPPQTTYTISGVLRATNGDQPLAGATIEASGQTATTNASGQFLFTLPLAPGVPVYTVSGAGLVTRSGHLTPGTSRSIDLDAFGPGFDADYFRQLAHNGYDRPGALAAISRWNGAPNIYLRTIDDAATAIDSRTLDMTEAVIRAVVPMWTAGRFAIAAVERGTEARPVQNGWLNVVWVSASDGICGQAPIGAWFGGTVELHYRTPRCSCGGYMSRPSTVKHELGHAMGFWHSGTATDLMYASRPDCDQDPSAKERQYADYVYRRSNGNIDPDTDAATTYTARSVMVID